MRKSDARLRTRCGAVWWMDRQGEGATEEEVTGAEILKGHLRLSGTCKGSESSGVVAGRTMTGLVVKAEARVPEAREIVRRAGDEGTATSEG